VNNTWGLTRGVNLRPGHPSSVHRKLIGAAGDVHSQWLIICRRARWCVNRDVLCVSIPPL